MQGHKKPKPQFVVNDVFLFSCIYHLYSSVFVF